MAHLSGFGLENFRVFKEYTWFDFAPITLLVGPNNSGKSSLIKALLLLKDNVDKGNLPPSFNKVAEGYSHSWPNNEVDYEDYNEAFEPSKLEFSDLIHGLNSVSTVKNKYSSNDEIVFDFSLWIITNFKKRMTGKQFFGISFDKIPDHFLGEKQKVLEDFKDGIQSMISRVGIEDWETKAAFPLMKHPKCRLTFKVNKTELVATKKIEILTEENELLLRVSAKSVYFNLPLYVTYFNENEFSTDESRYFQNEISESFGITFKHWFLQNTFEEEDAEKFSKKVLKSLFLSESSASINFDAINLFKRIDHFSTIWNNQKRVYTEDDGLKTTQQLKKLVDQINKGFNFESFFEGYSRSFGIDGLPAVEYDRNRGTFFPNINGESFLSFGYGYSQIASILFKIAIHATEKYIVLPNSEVIFENESSMLIFEEPETNLHPKIQSELANLIAEVMGDINTQFLIETHSEYMIRKFQYLVAKGEMKPEDIVIYYFHDPNDIPKGEKHVKKITILEDGSLSDDFGPGFFDEAANLAMSLFDVRKNRQN